MNEDETGPQFLKQKYNLHNTPEVESAAKRTQARTGERVPQNPADRIQNYLNRFKEILERKDPDTGCSFRNCVVRFFKSHEPY